jgi:LacI family transcriptional regulator
MKFRSLPIQVAEHITQEITKGRWVEWLPGERVLAEILQVSRRTLSAAIILLNKENIVRSEKGRGNRIIKRMQPMCPEMHAGYKVGLLIPDPLGLMRPGTALWVNDLRSKLSEEGGVLTTFHGAKYFSKHPARALGRLVECNPQSCWVIARSSLETQRWFAEQKVPCVLAGTSHPEVNLPDIDTDHWALCFHAANTILGKGHRKVVLLLTESPRYMASEQDAEAGFLEAFKQRSPDGAEPIIVYHKRGPNSLLRVLKQLFSIPPFPTAIITTHGMDYLTVISFMAQRRLYIPSQVSVISRNDDTFLDALVPTPTRYRYGSDSQFYAGKLYKIITHIIGNTPLPQRHVRIEPKFIKGESVANAPAV